MAPRGANKIAGRSGERTSNHSTNAVRAIEQFPRDFAHAVKVRDGNHVFVRGNLEYTVTRRINNRFSRANMFFAELFNDFRPRSRLVSNSFSANLFLKF